MADQMTEAFAELRTRSRLLNPLMQISFCKSAAQLSCGLLLISLSKKLHVHRSRHLRGGSEPEEGL